MVEVLEGTLIPHGSEVEDEFLNNLKPKLMQALKEKSYLSELHKVLDEKSKCTRFTDIIVLHPSTSVHYSVKEKVAFLVSEWCNEYLDTQLIEINDTHKRDYPLTVLLPVVLECISNSEIVAIKSDNEETSDHELITNPDASQ